MECDLEVETSAAEIPEELQPPNDSVRYIKRDPQFTGFVVTDEDDYCADENFMHCVAQLSSVMGRDADLKYDDVANILLDRYEMAPSQVLKAFSVCVLEVPHCAAFYANVVCHFNNKNPNVVSEIIETMSQYLNEYLEKGDMSNSKFILRFFSQLVNSGVVESSEFLELCRLFTSVTAEPQMNLYRCDMFIYLVLTALPWSAQKLHEECPGVLRELLQIIEAYMDQRKQLQEYESVLASVELCSPFDNEGVFIGEPIKILWNQTRESHDSEKFELAFLDTYTNPDPADGSLKHKLSSVVIPGSKVIPIHIYKPQFYIITPETAKDDPLLLLPDPGCINRFIIDDVVTDLIRLYSHNHGGCIDVLMTERLYVNIKSSPKSTVFDYRACVVECIIKEILALPTQRHTSMYYNSLIINLVHRRDSDLTRILGRIIRILFTMFDCPDNCSRGINFESLKNLVSWFSVHLSNFRFIWNWEHWEGSYESVKDSAKYIFVKETIECCVRLSYPRNIINVTKDTLKAPADILPDVIHTVNSKFNPETIQNTKLCEAVKNIQDLIINKEDSQKIGEVLQGIDGISLEEDDSENGETVSAKHVLFDCVLVYGSKSISYLLHVLEKYQSLLKAFNKNQEEMFETLYITASFWKNNTQVLEIVIDRLSNYGIVSDETVVSWLLSEQIVESFCHRMFFSRILHAILYKPVLRLLQNDSTLKKKLEAEDSTMDVDGCREKSYDASTDGENDLDERAKALKLHEKSKAIILSRKRSLFILTFRRFSDAINRKFSQMRLDNVEAPEETTWARWMFDHFIHIGTCYQDDIRTFSSDIERALFASGNIEPSVATYWETFKSYYRLFE